MKLKAGLQQQYDEYKAKNQDPYGGEVVRYSEDWADLMEKGMAEGKSIKDIAALTSGEADTSGITVFMYGCAVSGLAHFWEHGEELRRWHNSGTQLGTEGDEANEKGGVLNPAIISIGTQQ